MNSWDICMQAAGLVIVALLVSCASSRSSSSGTSTTQSSSNSSQDRIGFEEARAMFAGRGVQPGQPLPTLSLVNLDGSPGSISQVQAGRPMVLVTASLTCNVARRRQPDVNAIQQRFGSDVAVIVIYTIDAHPKGDPCPYTGKEWVPKDNEKDGVLIRQPVDLQERIVQAREFKRRYMRARANSDQLADETIMVDTMDNASWNALGQAPNLGLLVDSSGTVRVRQGWFDPKTMGNELITMGLKPQDDG